MALNDVYRLRFEYSVAQKKCVNVFHYQETDEPDSGTAIELVASAWGTDVLPAFQAALSSVARFHCLIIDVAQGVFVPQRVATYNNLVGLGGDDPIPDWEVMQLVRRAGSAGTLRTSLLNVSGVAKGDTNGNELAASFVGGVGEGLRAAVAGPIEFPAFTFVCEPVIPIVTYARMTRQTVTIAAGANSVLTLAAAPDWSSYGFTVGGRISLKGFNQLVDGTYEILGISGLDLTVDRDLENGVYAEASATQPLTEGYQLQDEVTLKPSLGVLSRRRTSYTGVPADIA